MLAARRPSRRESLRRGIGLLASLALLVLVLIPAAFGGLSYVWCAPLGRVQSACCCRAARAAFQRESGEARCVGSKIDAACCEGHRVDSLPPALASLDPGAWVPPCLSVALPAPASPCARVSAMEEPGAHLRGHPPRAGPSTPLFALHCRYLI